MVDVEKKNVKCGESKKLNATFSFILLPGKNACRY